MFFSISRNKLSNFPVNICIHKFWINLDQGWSVQYRENFTLIFKGYADDFDLESNLEKIINQNSPKYLGNFCVFKISENEVEMFTDIYRGFPVFFQTNEQLTNLLFIPEMHTCWTDSIITLNDQFVLQETKFDLIGSVQVEKTIDADQAVDKIIKILDSKIQNFISRQKKPIKVFLSGGIDTTLIYSFLKKHQADIELVRGQFLEFDKFWLLNHGNIKRFWGYQQIHHYIQPCVLASGAPGDEFMLRSPNTVDLWLKHHNLNISDLLQKKQWANCLHKDYFNQAKHRKIFETQQPPVENPVWTICNIILNDWQHWHLGNTLTWTPLRDLSITKILLDLPIEQILPQIMNSDLSKKIIEKNSPGLSHIISDSKNTNNYLSNLVGLIA